VCTSGALGGRSACAPPKVGVLLPAAPAKHKDGVS
jgi:hypothetical protein